MFNTSDTYTCSYALLPIWYNEQFVICISSLCCWLYRSDVLVLQFSHERRDRRRREYVMIEENHDSIMGILAPSSEDNQKAFSLASKVEVRSFTIANTWHYMYPEVV